MFKFDFVKKSIQTKYKNTAVVGHCLTSAVPKQQRFRQMGALEKKADADFNSLPALPDAEKKTPHPASFFLRVNRHIQQTDILNPL